MQVMPPTWTDMSRLFGLGPSVEDPSANIAAGTAYLRLLYDRFGYPGLFAAYNAGPGRFAQSLQGRPLPLETRRYVAAVMANLTSGRPQNIAAAGGVPPAASTVFVVRNLPEQPNLNELDKAANASLFVYAR
jgi:soluble lytic murein transglycosylase-like protein